MAQMAFQLQAIGVLGGSRRFSYWNQISQSENIYYVSIRLDEFSESHNNKASV